MEDQEIQTLFLDLMRGTEALYAERLASLTEEHWDALSDLAKEQRCGPYIAYRLEQLSNVTIPPSIKSQQMQASLRALQIARECTIIHEVLAEKQIEHLFLKGVPLALRDYPAPQLRPMRDIDILVRPTQLEAAHQTLLELGGEIAAFAHKPKEISANAKHLPPFFSPNKVMPIELHRRVFSLDLPFPDDAFEILEREMWGDPRQVGCGTNALPVPSHEMMLIHLLIHGLYDHELNNGPLFITDLAYLLRNTQIDQKRFKNLVNELQIGDAVELAAAMLPPVERRILSPEYSLDSQHIYQMVAPLLTQSSATRSELKLSTTLAESSLQERVAVLFQRAFPDRTTMLTRWIMEGGRPEDTPGNIALFWLWFLWTRTRQIVVARSGKDSKPRQSLAALRAFLAKNANGF